MKAGAYNVNCFATSTLVITTNHCYQNSARNILLNLALFHKIWQGLGSQSETQETQV